MRAEQYVGISAPMFYLMEATGYWVEHEDHFPMLKRPQNPRDSSHLTYRAICESNWKCQPLEPYRYEITSMAISYLEEGLGDYLYLGVTFPVVSVRFIDILKRYPINFEAFPMPMVDRRTGLVTKREFFFLNNLDSSDILDHEKTERNEKRTELAFDTTKFSDAPMMFRDKTHLSFLYVREDIAHEIERAELIGFNLLKCEGILKLY